MSHAKKPMFSLASALGNSDLLAFDIGCVLSKAINIICMSLIFNMVYCVE